MEHIVGSADVFAAIKSNGFVVKGKSILKTIVESARENYPRIQTKSFDFGPTNFLVLVRIFGFGFGQANC